MTNEKLMNSEEQKTWETLKNLAIDDPQAQFKFSDRLARENNWTKQFAMGAIEEYKKFVFLAKHAGHPVTPSIEVDEAWHLHMIYTRSYWNEMCKEIDFQLHHGPTKGGKAENEKFTDWYTKTKESYKKYFGAPPVEYWPSAQERFTPQNLVKINTKDFLVFKKPKLAKMFACFSFVPLIFLMSDTTAWTLIAIILAILLIFFVVRLFRRMSKRSRYRNGGGAASGGAAASSCGGFWGCSSCSSSSSNSSSSGCSSDSSGCGGGGCGGCGG